MVFRSSGYGALTKRLAAQISLHKTLSTWQESKMDSQLVGIGEDVTILYSFLLVDDADFAADLQIVFQRAMFAMKTSQSETLATAFHVIDYAHLHACYAVMDAVVPEEPSPAVKEEQHTDDDEEQSPASKGGGKKSGKKAKKEIACLRPLCLGDSADKFVESLLDQAMQLKIFSLPIEDGSLLAIQSLVQDCDGLAKRIDQITPATSACRTHLKDVITSLSVLFQCSLLEPIGRPSPSATRSARQILLARADGNPKFQSALAVTHYRAGKPAMEVARAHCAAGMQDENADRVFGEAFRRFEQLLEPAFECVEAWLQVGNGGAAITKASYSEKLAVCVGLMRDAMMAVQQWSPSGLDKGLSNLAIGLEWCVLFLDIGSYIQLKEFMVELKDKLLSHVLFYPCKAARVDASMDQIVKAEQDNCDGTQPFEAVFQEERDPVADQSGQGTPPGSGQGNNEALASLEAPTHAFLAQPNQIMTELQSYASQVGRLVNIISEKAHKAFDEAGKCDITSERCKENLARMKDLLANCCQFVLDASILANTHPLQIIEVTSIDHRSHMATISSFCRGYRFLTTPENLALPLPDALRGFAEKLGLQSLMETFVQSYGQPMYDAHVNPMIATLISNLEAGAVTINAVGKD